ncbi:N-acyl-D-amino-acid deacylase family protein [Intestinibacter sp.]|uniref:N-acyl-D-amino-acid deacylase family protein n=1 Tax=Intestinibacter sp. TaxID=1965304 RepID=UPI002A74CCD4|nr:D-aminoacylase [Intestinibacter sp.]MDY2735692.1 D-aminoacylase [Intestinibacter sp.]
MYDVVIKNIKIIDGLKTPAYIGDVAISNGKIVLSPSNEEKASEIIDGTGLCICPGFIDAHSHGDIALGKDFTTLSKVSQGITTDIGGQCGFTSFPVNPKTLDLLEEDLSIFTDKFSKEMEGFTSFKKYLEYTSKLPLVYNTKFLVGHCTIRTAVMGFDNRKPTDDELEQMKALVREAMENGCMGISSGLIYTPGVYCDTDELVELCKVVKEYGGVYTTHMRNESNHLLDAINEAICVAEKADVPLCISHYKSQGKANWGLCKEGLKIIEDAIARGMDITLDQYPYESGMTHLYITIPPKYISNGIGGLIEYLKDDKKREEIKSEMLNPTEDYENFYLNAGGFEGIFIADCPEFKDPVGMTIADYARKIGADPFDAFFDILIKNKGVCTAIYFTMCEDDIFSIIKNENTVVGTDGIVKSFESKCHPRAYGTFPHAIDYFHKKNNLFTLEEIIAKITNLPATKYKIANKGAIKDGYDADLVIFDYDKIGPGNTYQEPDLVSEGIEYVIVGGEVVYHDKKLTGNAPGKIVLHNA